jgi:hypothetical protein
MRFSFAKNQYQVTAAVNAIIVLSALFVYDWIPLVDLVGQFLIDPDAPVKSNLIYLLGGDTWLVRR